MYSPKPNLSKIDIEKIFSFKKATFTKYIFDLQDDLVALLLNGIRYDRLDESASKTAGGYQVSLHIPLLV